MDKWTLLERSIQQLGIDSLSRLCEGSSLEFLSTNASRQGDRQAFGSILRLIEGGGLTREAVLGFAQAVLLQQNISKVRLILSGPGGDGWIRSTPAAFAEIVASASSELLFLTYALRHSDFPVQLLGSCKAQVRGVIDRALMKQPEQKLDSGLASLRDAGVQLYTWSPAVAGPASIHAKAVVADRRRLLITSANLTDRAFNDNLETGILVEDPSAANELVSYVDSLIARGVLSPVPDF